MVNVRAPAVRSILSECTVCGLDIKFVVCRSTRQSERLFDTILSVKRLFPQKTRQMRTVIGKDASAPTRQQTQPLNALWLGPGRRTPLSEEPAPNECPSLSSVSLSKAFTRACVQTLATQEVLKNQRERHWIACNLAR